jgi:hypothetical protein
MHTTAVTTSAAPIWRSDRSLVVSACTTCVSVPEWSCTMSASVSTPSTSYPMSTSVWASDDPNRPRPITSTSPSCSMCRDVNPLSIVWIRFSDMWLLRPERRLLSR